MATKRITWDPRSELAAEAVEAIGQADLAEPLLPEDRIAVLVCQHWIHTFADLETRPGINFYCQYCIQWQRLLKVVEL